jgi:hypothetical protein
MAVTKRCRRRDQRKDGARSLREAPEDPAERLLSTKGELERETGLEPATFSLDVPSAYAL